MLESNGSSLQVDRLRSPNQGFVSEGAWKELVMILLACFLPYLAIKKEYEPLLLVPIAFGMILINLGPTWLMDEPKDGVVGRPAPLFVSRCQAGIYPPLISSWDRGYD